MQYFPKKISAAPAVRSIMPLFIHTAVMHKSYINTANTKPQFSLKQYFTNIKKLYPNEPVWKTPFFHTRLWKNPT